MNTDIEECFNDCQIREGEGEKGEREKGLS
jgi:hypothetical protein